MSDSLAVAAHSWCPAPGERVQNEGHVSDGQLTTAWSVRYIADPTTDDTGEQVYPLVTITYYGEDINAPNDYTGQALVVERTELVFCTDPSAPGETGRPGGDIRYASIDSARPRTAVEAAAMCRRLAEEHTSRDITWAEVPGD
ncbi:hypothetical protein [Nonomuraea sp. NPDC050202]|uniref:hypothetical protein n=1 Tax=Nonomuraea sp. NPDC050202 TaxID=3155035 RepID=UPI0033DF88DD